MKIKKTWFSYLAWFIFSVYTGILFAVYLSAFCMKIWRLDKYGTIFLVCTAFAVCTGTWFLGRKISGYVSERMTADSHLIRMWEYFLVMCVFAGAALYRIYLFMHDFVTAGGGIYYDKALEGLPEIVNGAVYIYTAVLSFVLSFSGNHQYAVIFFQFIVQMAAIVTFYFAVRFMAGRLEALLSAAIMAFLPAVCRQIFYISPEPLYLLFYSIGLLLSGLYAAKSSSGIAAVLIGIYFGTMGYLDIAGWTLLIFAVFFCRKKAIFILSAVMGMTACIGIDAVISGKAPGSIFMAYWNTYASPAAEIHFPAGPDGVLAGVFICMCAAFGIIGFWFHRRQKQDAWILFLAAVLILDMINAGQMRYQIFITAIWSVLAGMGITSMGRFTRVNEITIHQELVIEEITDDDSGGPGVKYIENPLPLPKKHIKKEMDYDRALENMELDFDISTHENDDFDLL